MPGAGWLAAISYSLYLVHKALYHVVHQSNWGEQLGHGRSCVRGVSATRNRRGCCVTMRLSAPFFDCRDRLPFVVHRPASASVGNVLGRTFAGKLLRIRTQFCIAGPSHHRCGYDFELAA